MFELRLSRQVSKFLEKLPHKHANQIAHKISALLDHPFPNDMKHVEEFYRVDSGEYRILYHIEGNDLYVDLVGKRNDDEVYKKMRRILKK